jgi:hypothetical protein
MMNKFNSTTLSAKAVAHPNPVAVSRAPGFGNPAGANTADPGITALEQRVAELEAVVSQLTAVLLVSSNGAMVTLKAAKLRLDASIDVKVNCGLDFNVNAGANLALNSAVQIRLKGSLVRINDGTKPVARNGDPVGNGIITGGNSALLA